MPVILIVLYFVLGVVIEMGCSFLVYDAAILRGYNLVVFDRVTLTGLCFDDLDVVIWRDCFFHALEAAF